MKIKTAKQINVSLWILVAIILMIYCYFKWSEYGSYTLLSFIMSLLIHGSFSVLMWAITNQIIDNYFNEE